MTSSEPTSSVRHEPRIRMAVVAAGRIYDADYRVAFARRTRRFDVAFVGPQQPDAVGPERWRELRVGQGVSPRYLLEVLRLPRILRSMRVEVAHLFNTQLSTLAPVPVRLAGVTPVVTITGLGRAFDPGGPLRTLVRYLYLALFTVTAAVCPRVMFQTEGDCIELRRRLPRRLRHRCVVVGSSLDQSIFDGRSRPDPPADALPRVLQVTRLSPHKGIRDFLALAERFAGQATFTLVGPPAEEHEALLREVEEAAAAGLLDYRGRVLGEDLIATYLAHDIFVLPSTTEGIPRVLLEASLLGLASVTYDLPGCLEVLGPDGRCAPLGDLERLSELLAELFDDPDRRASEAATAASRVRTDFTPEAYTARVEAALEGVVRRHHGARTGSGTTDDRGGRQ